MTSARCDESGFAGGIEALVFGTALFIAGSLLVAGAWGVVDAKAAATAAAREAARAYVEASSAAAGDAAARSAAEEVMIGHGRNAANTTVVVSAPAGLARCAPVVIEVTHQLRLGRIPFTGRSLSTSSVSARHAERVDPYRSGLPGRADCG